VAAVRRPIFELHIRPMFRLLDEVHMLRLPPAKRVNLRNYQEVRDDHLKIIDFLQSGSPMPPTAMGGPWPEEWINLFIRWTQTGFGRLAEATGSNFQLVPNPSDRFTLSCLVALADPTATAWFDILQAQPDAQIYQVVVDQPDSPVGPSSTRSIEERIRGPLTVSEVVVLDAAGEHRVAVPSS